MDAAKAGGLAVLVLALLMGLGWLFQGNDFFLYKFFAPKYEQVRRETYEQTKSYRQASTQRLNELCRQVADADDEHKGMLNSIISQEFAEWDTADVPVYLHSCLTGARGH